MKKLDSELKCLESRISGTWGHARDVLKIVNEECTLPGSERVQAIFRMKRDIRDIYNILETCQQKLTPPLIEAAE